MDIVITILIIYILCVVLAYTFFHRIYSKGGRWYGVEPEPFDLFITLMPIVNFVILIMWIIEGSRKREKSNLSWFFRIK